MRNSWAEGPALATVKSTRPPLTVGGVAWIVKSLSTTAMFGTALAVVTDFVRALRPMATTEAIRAITDSMIAIPGLDRRVSGGAAPLGAARGCSGVGGNLPFRGGGLRAVGGAVGVCRASTRPLSA